ncbi:Petrobactin biosynthesis protein AsbE [Paenibacillus sp. N4]|nr:Petrobactin biosynthesis protein AsbE [Paenibacillus vietnamensis]
MFGWKEQRIKVHCVVSCLCEVIKRHSDVDYRPFYFHVWDSDFSVTDSGLSYYAEEAGHGVPMDWYERLFGIRTVQWHDPARDPAANADRLAELVENAPKHRHVVVQIDMSFMPERENKYNLSPFPHYVLVYATGRSDEWYMLDADMKWEGIVSREQVLQAFVQNRYPDGFYIEADSVRAPAPEAVAAYFYDRHDPEKNELVAGLRKLAVRMAAQPERLPQLAEALKQLHVIVIRKYGYDYALMFFHDELELPRDNYEHWAQQIRDLVQAFNTVQFTAVKISLTGRADLLPSLLDTLDKAEAIERGIKLELERELVLWSARYAGTREERLIDA